MKTMMRNLKKILVMSLALCLLTGNTVQAEETEKLYMEGYTAKDNQLNIYLNTTAKEDFTKDDFEVIIGDNTYPVENLQTFEASGQNVSYLFLVDVSGSVTEADITNSKEILGKMTELMKDGDNAAVLEIRDEIGKCEFLSSKEALTERIDAIERTKEDTNLYLGIRNALDALSSDEACYPKKCLVVISDGKDDQKNGILFEDVRDAVKNADIPVCTLAMPLRASEQSEGLAPDKVMKSFTENAAGGVYINYAEKSDNAVIAEAFDSFAHTGYIVSVSLTDFASNASSMTLSVRAKTESAQMEDSCQIPSYVMASVAEMSQPEEAKEPVAEEVSVEPIAEVQEESAEGKLIYVLVILIILVLGAVVAALVIRKKRAEAVAEAETKEKESKEKGVERAEAAGEKAVAPAAGETDLPTEAAEDELLPTQKEEMLQNSKTTISLIKMGIGATDVYSAVCDTKILIGRSKNADITIADDRQLSGKHCEIRKDGSKFYIRDLDSTNGTILNGLPIKEEMPLLQDDVIYIGSFEYRVVRE